MKVKGFHLIAGSANGVLSLILPVFKHILTRDLRLRLVVHAGTGTTLEEGLKQFGMISKNLSDVIGGEWTTYQFQEWCDHQIDIEEGKCR